MMYFELTRFYGEGRGLYSKDLELQDFGYTEIPEGLSECIFGVDFEWGDDSLRCYGKDEPYSGFFMSIVPKKRKDILEVAYGIETILD